MAFGSEVYDKVGVEVGKYFINDRFVVDVAIDEIDVVAFYVVGDAHQITGVSQRVEHNNVDVVSVFVEEEFNEVSANETGATGNEIIYAIFVNHIMNVLYSMQTYNKKLELAHTLEKNLNIQIIKGYAIATITYPSKL
jgi:hypothetical protein